MRDSAAKIVSVLLDSEEDEFLLHDIAQSSLNPGYEFVQAMKQGMGIVRYFHANDPWAYDLMIRVSEDEHQSKLRQIWVKWARPKDNHCLVPEQDAGGGYASYDVKDADAIGHKLGALIKASKVHTVGSDHMRQAYSALWVMHWMPRASSGRRRSRV